MTPYRVAQDPQVMAYVGPHDPLQGRTRSPRIAHETGLRQTRRGHQSGKFAVAVGAPPPGGYGCPCGCTQLMSCDPWNSRMMHTLMALPCHTSQMAICRAASISIIAVTSPRADLPRIDACHTLVSRC